MKKTLVILSLLLSSSGAFATEIAYCKIAGQKETIRMVLNDYGYARHVLQGNLNFYVSTESLPVVDVGIDQNTDNPQFFKMLTDKKGSIDQLPVSVSLENAPSVDCWVNVASFSGKFALNHEVAYTNYASAKDCKKDKMTWNGGLCSTYGDDLVEVSIPNGDLNIEIDTMTTNAHTCSFSAKAKVLSYTKLEASSPSEVYNRQTKKLESATCVLTLTYTPDHNSVSSTTNGKCNDMCGMNASLEVENAKRKK